MRQVLTVTCPHCQKEVIVNVMIDKGKVVAYTQQEKPFISEAEVQDYLQKEYGLYFGSLTSPEV
jgi:hypothetical protein